MRSSEAVQPAPDGTRLFTRRWSPDGEAKASVLLVHGLGEHSGRYESLATHLCEAGYTVRAFDLRGHGRTSGRRGDARFGPTSDDLDRLLAQERQAGRPVFLYGHSLGGLVVLAHALDRQTKLAGVVASAPGLHTAVREQRLKVLLARLVGRILPGLSVPSGLDSTLLSRDPVVIEEYLADPLVHTRMTVGFGADGMVAIDRVLAHPGPFPGPLLLMHGDADGINYLSGSMAVAERFGATLRVYPGGFHEPHHDLDRTKVLADLTDWLDAQL